MPSRSWNQSLKEYFSVIKLFPGATTQGIKDYIKPSIWWKPNMIILHPGTNDLKSTKDPSDITNEIVQSSKKIKSNRTEVVLSFLIPRGNSMSE